MSGQLVPWALQNEGAVARGHPTKDDVINRALRFILTSCGLDPDVVFPGFLPVFHVAAYGAVGDGDADDTGAVASAVAAINAAGRGRLYIPRGMTVKVSFATPGVPIFTFTADNVIVQLDGTLKASAAAPVTSAAQEQGQYVFYATNRTGIHFTGCGTFDGNRNAATDPCAGFFKGVQTSDVSFDRSLTFQDSGNEFGGVIAGTSDNGVTSAEFRNWKIRGTFKRSAWATHLIGDMSNIAFRDIALEKLDLDSPNGGHLKYGVQSYSGRGVRISVGTNARTQASVARNVSVKGVVVDDATLAVEFWNNDATFGKNTDNIREFSISGVSGSALFPISVVGVSNGVVTDYALRRTTKTAAQIASYTAAGGHATIADSSGSTGAMIEARGPDITIGAGTIDGCWTGGGTDYTASIIGVAIGDNGAVGMKCSPVVSPACKIKRCYYAVDAQDCQGAVVSPRVTESRNAFRSTTGANPNGHQGNLLQLYARHPASVATTAAPVVLTDGWVMRDFDVQGDPTTRATYLIDASQTTATVAFIGGTLKNFTSRAVYDASLDSTYRDVDCDAGSGGSATQAIVLKRQANKIVRFQGRNTIRRCDGVIGWEGAAAAGEAYTADTFVLDTVAMNAHKAFSGGTIFDMPFFMGRFAAGPSSGYWSAGCFMEYLAPAAGGFHGKRCTTSGSFGTWKDFGAVQP